VVVRLEGTNVELGQQILRESGLNFTVASGMKDAAEKVCGAFALRSYGILVDDNTRLLVQGITGREGLFTLSRRLRTEPRLSAE